MAAASYHPRILILKYEQTDNVKPLTTNRGLQFAVGWPNLDLKVSINNFHFCLFFGPLLLILPFWFCFMTVFHIGHVFKKQSVNGLESQINQSLLRFKQSPPFGNTFRHQSYLRLTKLLPTSYFLLLVTTNTKRVQHC